MPRQQSPDPEQQAESSQQDNTAEEQQAERHPGRDLLVLSRLALLSCLASCWRCLWADCRHESHRHGRAALCFLHRARHDPHHEQHPEQTASHDKKDRPRTSLAAHLFFLSRQFDEIARHPFHTYRGGTMVSDG